MKIGDKMKKILNLFLTIIFLLCFENSVISKDFKTVIKELITPKEARLPNAKGELKTRGISRGPGIKVISPDVNIAEVKAEIKTPFDLKVAFEPRGGIKIDPNSVKVTYLKFPYIDLTDRLKPGISENGIDFPKANIPSGEHSVRINVKDVDGRESSLIVTLVAIK
jgi:hypothetical protein